jgi:hypothetical protein
MSWLCAPSGKSFACTWSHKEWNRGVQASTIWDLQADEQPVILGSAEQNSFVGQKKKQNAPTKATRQRIVNVTNAMLVLFVEVAIFRVLAGCGIAPPHLVIVHGSWPQRYDISP